MCAGWRHHTVDVRFDLRTPPAPGQNDRGVAKFSWIPEDARQWADQNTNRVEIIPADLLSAPGAVASLVAERQAGLTVR